MKNFKTFFPLVLESQAVSRLNFFLLLKYISRPITGLLLPVVPHQQTETKIILVSFQMLCLTRNAVHPVSQSPMPNQWGSVQASSFLLTPNKVDCVAQANRRFSTFLFLILYSSSYKSFLSFALFGSSPKRERFMKCWFCLYH